jgi:hypothetical protein
LVTAGEYLSNGTQVLRCRLDGSWSFLARAVFSSIAGALLIVIGFLGGWWWGLLMILPPLAWRIHLAEVDLTRLIVSFLDERAKEFGLVKLPPSSTK